MKRVERAVDGLRQTGALFPGDPERMGPYLLLRRIGEGGMGSVFLGRAPDGRKVAVKVVRSELAPDAKFVARFHDEVANARRVAGFCTAAVLDQGEDAGRAYMVTEYIDGRSLLEYVDENGPLPDGMLQGVAVGVTAALAAIHSAGLIHRDLKPSNVLLSLSGPRVIDFGISRAMDAVSAHTLTGQVIGSPGWMAPEQIRQEPVTTAADIFAWGCLIHYAGTGLHPYGSGDFATLAARIGFGSPDPQPLPGPLGPLVRRALGRTPSHRPTAQELLLHLVGGDTGEGAVLASLSRSWSGTPTTPQATATAPAEIATSPTGRIPSAPPPPPPPPTARPAEPATAAGRPTAPPTEIGTRPTGRVPSAGPDTAPAPPYGLAGAAPPTPPYGGNDRGEPAPAPPDDRRRNRVWVALVAGGVIVGAAAGVSAWLLLKPVHHQRGTLTGAPTVKSAAESVMYLRLDTAKGWPKDCHAVIAKMTPATDQPVRAVTPPSGACDILPEFSHDHTRVAFTRQYTDGRTEAWVLDTRTGGLTKVTDLLTKESRVAWSPDDTRLAFTGKGDGTARAIYQITIGRSDATRLTHESADEDDAAYSPTDGRLAFWSKRDGTPQIYVLDPADPAKAWLKLTDAPKAAGDPAWSPDGTRIAFTYRDGTESNIWLVSAAGGTATAVTTGADQKMDPCWSRDGKWIGYTKGATGAPRIWMTHPDGTGDRAVSVRGQDEAHPTW